MQTKRVVINVCFGILGLGAATSLLAEQAATRRTGTAGAASASANSIGIVGKQVRNTAGDSLGVVENVLINPSSGQVTALVVGIGGVLGYGAYKYEVPWQRVRFAQDHARVLLNVPRDKVSSEFSAYKPQSNPSQSQSVGGHEPSDSGAHKPASESRDIR
ncbi:MAG TPA: PRC-barrel domain-containing protein [Nitrococcus sp.]|nr:PRC-barrel domain-containing protein [Nitrococcus sp.]